MSDQDGKASIPQRARDFLLWLFGSVWVAVLDSYGAKHDEEIAKFGYILAALLMAVRLIIYPILFFLLVSLLVSLGVIFYAIVPKCLKALYWRWF